MGIGIFWQLPSRRFHLNDLLQKRPVILNFGHKWGSKIRKEQSVSLNTKTGLGKDGTVTETETRGC